MVSLYIKSIGVQKLKLKHFIIIKIHIGKKSKTELKYIPTNLRPYFLSSCAINFSSSP